MFGLRYAFGIFCLLILSASTAFSQSANYPDKPVTIISNSAAGSSPDVVARFVAEGLGKLWGQQVVVLNKPGANGSIAAHAASEAPPDGYTLFHPTLSTFVALPTIAPISRSNSRATSCRWVTPAISRCLSPSRRH